MDLKKLKKQSATLGKNAGVEGSGATKKADTDSAGIKSTLKITGYNHKYSEEVNEYQDNSGIKKYKSGTWTLQGEDNQENMDNGADNKLKFLDENGDEVAMQG
ncbi:hypothetical protein HB364_29170 [Pseudoflavitalea sp. X16]|uniref:hypothetical protein n=1 Tax=Paraflavitalea devenefica TaxID=2716334 RepID=UPI00141F8FB7|nr:hypothetical protein [Paraflavitalea devenefica]NII29186.1 hypothetical protein [Paraflavitalea devenefica]